MQIFLLVNTWPLLVLALLCIDWAARRARASTAPRLSDSRWYKRFELGLYLVGMAVAFGWMVATGPIVLVLGLLSVAVLLLTVFAYVSIKQRRSRQLGP